MNVGFHCTEIEVLFLGTKVLFSYISFFMIRDDMFLPNLPDNIGNILRHVTDIFNQFKRTRMMSFAFELCIFTYRKREKVREGKYNETMSNKYTNR